MKWTPSLIQFWLENYYAIRNYELNPFQEISVFKGEQYIHGRQGYDSPYEEVVDMNISFDRALHKLGDKERIFREKFIDSNDRPNKLYREFLGILTE